MSCNPLLLHGPEASFKLHEAMKREAKHRVYCALEPTPHSRAQMGTGPPRHAAHDRDAEHFPAWAAFNRSVGHDGTVGLWHETNLIEPGKLECVYSNMPRFGLGAVASHIPAEGHLSAAADRMRSL